MRTILSLIRNAAVLTIVIVGLTSDSAKAEPWCTSAVSGDDFCVGCQETTSYCGGSTTCKAYFCLIGGEVYDDSWCESSRSGGVCYA